GGDRLRPARQPGSGQFPLQDDHARAEQLVSVGGGADASSDIFSTRHFNGSDDRDRNLRGHLSNLPARLSARPERCRYVPGTSARNGEEETARRLRLEQQVDERFGKRSIDRELTACAERALDVAAVPLHAAAPVALLGKREGAR